MWPQISTDNPPPPAQGPDCVPRAPWKVPLAFQVPCLSLVPLYLPSSSPFYSWCHISPSDHAPPTLIFRFTPPSVPTKWGPFSLVWDLWIDLSFPLHLPVLPSHALNSISLLCRFLLTDFGLPSTPYPTPLPFQSFDVLQYGLRYCLWQGAFPAQHNLLLWTPQSLLTALSHLSLSTFY